MTPRERVIRAVEFRCPDRIPLQFSQLGMSDIHGVWLAPPRVSAEGEERKDEWGCAWQRSEVDNMGQVKEPPIKNWEDQAAYPFPDPDDPHRYGALGEKIAEGGGKYVILHGGHGLFERAWLLRGYEIFLIGLVQEPRHSAGLLDRILSFHCRVVKNIRQKFGDSVQAYSIADDWGTQLSTVISLSLWRRFFKERYRRLFDEIHRAGMHAWLHSCGKVNDFIGEFIEAGLNVINLQQSRTVGIREIGERYRGKICFEGIVDVQRTLPRGSPEEIEREAEELLRFWGTPQGGFIASDYEDSAALGVTRERKLVMFEAFKKFGKTM